MRTRTAATLAMLAAAAAGCSSSSHHDSSPTPAAPSASSSATPTSITRTTPAAAGPDKAALVAAVRDYSAAYFRPDATKGYSLLSAQCKSSISPTEYKAELSAAVATYGHQAVQVVTVDQLAGGLARVSYTYSVPALNQHRQPWTVEGGAWRYDGC